MAETMVSEHRSVVTLNFSDEFPTEWQHRLQTLKASGANALRLNIFWGAHEPVRGMRDFAKASRLRLERLLRLAVEERLEVEVVVGFPAGKETLPLWSQEGFKPTWVPASVWKADAFGFGLAQVPSLSDEAFRVSFLQFVDELFAILALYLAPEGTLRKILVDFGIYEFDLTAMESPHFLKAVQERHGSINSLNQTYHTAFKDLTSVGTRQGFRTLMDKRSWLAAHDYKLGRDATLWHLYECVKQLPSCALLTSVMERRSHASLSAKVDSAWGILIEDTLIENLPDGRTLPLSPGGHHNETAVQARRLLEYLREHCDENRVGFWNLNGSLEGASRFALISGKFLPSAVFGRLTEKIRGGASIFFPLGLPQYEENLRSLAWPTAGKTMLQRGDRQYLQIPFGEGELIVAIPPIPTTPVFWDELVKSAGSVWPLGDATT